MPADPCHTTVHTGPYTAVREVAPSLLGQRRKAKRFEIGIGKPDRKGLSLGKVPRAESTAGCVCCQPQTAPQFEQSLSTAAGQRAEPHVRLYRDAQEVRPVPTEIPVHDWTVPVSCYPHERDRSAAGARSLDYTGVQVRTTATKEGRGALRGAKKSQSHRSQSAPAAQVEVRTRTVLPSGHCPEHQAAGPVPQPASDVAGTRHFIGRTAKTDATTLFNPQNDQNGADFFNTHACYH